MFEVCSEAAQKHLKLPRNLAVIAVGAIVFAAGLFIEEESKLNNWMNIVSIYIVPIGAALGAIVIFWVLGTKKIKEELQIGREKTISNAFDILAKYVYVPIAILVVILGIMFGGIG